MLLAGLEHSPTSNLPSHNSLPMPCNSPQHSLPLESTPTQPRQSSPTVSDTSASHPPSPNNLSFLSPSPCRRRLHDITNAGTRTIFSKPSTETPLEKWLESQFEKLNAKIEAQNATITELKAMLVKKKAKKVHDTKFTIVLVNQQHIHVYVHISRCSKNLVSPVEMMTQLQLDAEGQLAIILLLFII